MTTFKKMALVSEDEILRMKQKEIREYNPEIRTLAFIQTEIDDLLNNKDMSVEDKLLLIQSAQKRFSQLAPSRLKTIAPYSSSKVVIQPATQNLPDTQPENQVEEERTKSAISRRIIPAMPKNMQMKATQMLDWINDHPGVISTNDNMELSIDGEKLPSSNFVDLLRELYAPRLQKPPGYNEFLVALKSINAPISLVSDRKVKSFLTSSNISDNPFLSDIEPTTSSSSSSSKTIITVNQDGNGFKKPPGKAPKILRLYRI